MFQDVRAPLFDDHGQVMGLLSISMDVTEQKRAEDQLISKERLLQTVFDSIPHSIFVKDAEGRYLLGNNALLESFNRSSP